MSERSSVQNPMLRYADHIGWHYVSPKDALRLRGGETGLYFSEILTSQLQKLLFETYMTGPAKEYIALSLGWDDKSKEKAIEYFKDKDIRENFF